MNLRKTKKSIKIPPIIFRKTIQNSNKINHVRLVMNMLDDDNINYLGVWLGCNILILCAYVSTCYNLMFVDNINDASLYLFDIDTRTNFTLSVFTFTRLWRMTIDTLVGFSWKTNLLRRRKKEFYFFLIIAKQQNIN